jgi:hypothetical protein
MLAIGRYDPGAVNLRAYDESLVTKGHHVSTVAVVTVNVTCAIPLNLKGQHAPTFSL